MNVEPSRPVPPAIRRAIAAVEPPDPAWHARAADRQSRLTMPPGSLGRLLDLGRQLAAIQRSDHPRGRPALIAVFAADHGVTAAGVSAYPREVTGQMVANYLRGGAAVNILAARAGATVLVADLGVAHPVVEPGTRPGFLSAPIRAGTSNFLEGPAMTREEAYRAVEFGRGLGERLASSASRSGSTDSPSPRSGEGRGGRYPEWLVPPAPAVPREEGGGFEDAPPPHETEGHRVIALGEMGIGNTTSASALLAALTGAPIELVVGRGTGVDDAGLDRKRRVVADALDRHAPAIRDTWDAIERLGGFEILGLAGLAIGAARHRAVVVLDGLISTVAGLIAARLCPTLRGSLVASHLGAEPGHRVALEALGLEPLLSLGLRLGEGTGAALALPILDSAAAILRDMATFDEADVSGPEESR